MAKNTIKVKKYSDVIEEYAASGAITPGMLIELDSATTVGFHSTASGNALPMFALEDELQGNGIDDAYAAADRVQCWVPYRGDIVYALLDDGEDVSAGDFLESAGNGKLQKHVADSTGDIYTQSIVAQAIEAVDMSGSAGEDPDGRILVRIV
jgi:hypothetical protein